MAELNSTSEANWCEHLYEIKAPELILYGRSLGLSHTESEDVLQETFLALIKLADMPENPEHYCLRTFRNRAFNYRRTFWRRLCRELESSRWFEPSEKESDFERSAMRGLSQLPVAQREVIVLKIWHQRTFEEIGELVGISPNTAAGRYRYGIGKLQAQLKGKNYERDESVRESIALVEAATSLSDR